MKRNNIFAKLILAVLALAMIQSSCSLAGSLEELRPNRNDTNYYNFPLWVYNLEELEEMLPNAVGGETEDLRGEVHIIIELGVMTDLASNWQKMLDIIDESGKYIDLNLAECGMANRIFNPAPSVITGKDRIVSIVLPDMATAIPSANSNPNNSAFRYFTNLKNVNGSKISEIGSYAFYGINKLSTIKFSETTTIGEHAFLNCTSLTQIDFSSLENIDYAAFQSTGSTYLEIKMGYNEPKLGVDMFNGVAVTKNVMVKVPTGVLEYDDEWQKGFKGAGWNGSNILEPGKENNYINLIIDDS
ncbi:MAG: leucine-rich repeat domain-containing protein [Treponema sp.]|nr:leucine-rich repeat domain-containing protein [Treponema sp.]